MNKSLLIVAGICVFIASCGTRSGATFGTDFDTEGASSITQAMEGFDAMPSKTCKLEGKVADVCQAEGCWFRLTDGTGKELMVRMRDHSFSVPKDLAGMDVVVQGELVHDTTSVEQLRDFAKDDGKSQAEIDAIVSPEISDVLFADGVAVR